MSKLSEHFNKEDFSCHCNKCQKEVKISLTLIGILEDVCSKFHTKIQIKKGFLCSEAEAFEPGPKKNYHGIGKAVDFTIGSSDEDKNLKLTEIFRYLETFPEITGLGLNLHDNYIHVDLREKEPTKWVYQKGEEVPLTDDLRSNFGLGDNVAVKDIPKPITLSLPVDV